MRRRRPTLVIGLLLVLIWILVTMLWIRNRSRKTEYEILATTNNTPVAEAKTNTGANNGRDAVPAGPSKVPPPGLAEKLGIPADALNNIIEQWNTPIDFYGKVLDENDRPVAGASIDFSANDLSPEGRTAYQKVSDSKGLFSILGIRGKFLHVRVSKPGYQTSKRDQITFSYAGGDSDQISPDPNNPVPFHLYKIKTGDSNGFPCSLAIKLPIDGSLVGVDLKSCRAVPYQAGQLVLSCKSNSRTPENSGKFAWEVTISVPDGGVLIGNKEANFEAPETGYSESLTIKHSPTDADWRLDVNSEFFARFSNGTFARFHVFVFGHNGRGQFQALLNPSGSRDFGELPP